MALTAIAAATRLAASPPPSAEDLMGMGRDAEAEELLRGAVALQPRDATAYRLLGGLLGERWERWAQKTLSTDFGVRDGVHSPELRSDAVEALTHSVRLAPSALVHAVIGNLLTPNGRGATTEDMRTAAGHFEAALALDASVHSGTIDAAQRLSFQRHLLICTEEALSSAEEDEDGASPIAAASRMGDGACAAYRSWAQLQPTHGEAHSILHYDCGGRMLRPRPRVPEMPTQAISSLGALQTTPAELEQARALFGQHGVAVFDRLLPVELCSALATELAVNGSQQRLAVNGRLRSDTVGDPSDATLRWNHAQSPGHGAVAEIMRLVAQQLGDFLAAVLGGSADDVQLLECATIVTYPGAPPQTWHADSDLHNACEATAAVLQVQLVDMQPALGPIEVRPFVPLDAEQTDLPMLVRAGSVIAYDSKVWHRGGANAGDRPRPVLYTTWMASDDGLLPRNLGYTMPRGDVGAWTLGRLRGEAAGRGPQAKRAVRRRAVPIEVSAPI